MSLQGLSRRQLLAKAAAGAGLSSVLPVMQAPENPKQAAPYQATSQYAIKEFDGWTARVSPQLTVDHAGAYSELTLLLHFQLYQIKRVVPAKALSILQKIPIWIEWNEPHHPCSVFHPDAGWLREHGMNPEKAGCVEIAKATNFLKWTIEQPWMALHELAHGYHHAVLGFDNPEVKTAYDAAVKSGSYESVLRYSGRKERHYALTNPQEYFAECSEAYFGTNDFYPFVRPELKLHDPTGYAMIEKLWGVKSA